MRPIRRKSTRTPKRDKGFVLITQVLMLGVLITMTALAVDVGSFYNRATDLQKAADAAALAAVVWMPDNHPTATSVARDAAKQNGFTHGVNGVTVNVATVPGNPRQVKVTVTDPNVPTIFGKMITDRISMKRSAVAEYVLAVPLGSPDNKFGNQGTPVSPSDPNLWAAINGPYTAREQGDPFATRCTNSSSATSCTSSNPDYRNTGYTYAVEVPPSGVGRELTVEVFDAGFYHGSLGTGTGDTRLVGSQGPPMRFELFEADSTPLDNSDNPTLNGRCTTGPGRLTLAAGASASTYRQKWATLCTFTALRSGVYPLQVKSGNISGQPEQGNATSHYSLRSSLSGGGDQPRIYGIGDMSIYTGNSGTSTFYLAEVDSIHAGKTFEIELFDPGDGSSGNYFLEILKPDGTVATCRYTNAAGNFGSTGTCRIQTRVNGAPTPNIYNGKWLTIRLDLPPTYSCTNCWWKVRYDVTGSPTDRTTWRAAILGDPVHLVE